MKAIIQDRYGSADVLEVGEVERPTPEPGEVLIRVQAASVNAADWHIMRGSPVFLRLVEGLRRPRHRVRGVDVSGTVEAIGAGVTRFKPGDEVMGWCGGSFAEYAAAPEDHFVRKPAGLTFEQASTVGIAAFTALQGIRDQGAVRPDQKVLIIGASGGVGTFAVQIAKAFGAEATGVCSTRNVELVRSLGADHVIDYTTTDFTRNGQRYDVILQLAGTHMPSTLRRSLTPRGTLVLSSGDGRFTGIDRILQAMLLRPFVRQRLRAWVSQENQADLVALKELIEAGKVRPVIDRTYPLGLAPDAIRHVEVGHTQGKTVITI